MSISAFDPKRLVSRGQAAMNSPLAKALDWAMAIAFALYAAWLVYQDWPAPTAWTLASVAIAAFGIFLASYDWKSRLDAKLRSLLIKRH